MPGRARPVAPAFSRGPLRYQPQASSSPNTPAAHAANVFPNAVPQHPRAVNFPNCATIPTGHTRGAETNLPLRVGRLVPARASFSKQGLAKGGGNTLPHTHTTNTQTNPYNTTNPPTYNPTTEPYTHPTPPTTQQTTYPPNNNPK